MLLARAQPEKNKCGRHWRLGGLCHAAGIPEQVFTRAQIVHGACILSALLRHRGGRTYKYSCLGSEGRAQ